MDKNYSWGRWIYWIMVPVAIVALLHGIAGAYHASMLPAVDSYLYKLTAGLEFIGLGVTRPAITGPLGFAFYANQVAIETWGVVFCSCVSIVQLLRGRNPVLPFDRFVQLEMQRSNSSWRRAYLWIAFAHIFLTIPFTGMFVLVFLNGCRGWYVLTVQQGDWATLNILTLVMLYMPGAVAVPLIYYSFAYVIPMTKSSVRLFVNAE